MDNKPHNLRSLKLLSWRDIRSRVTSTNKELAALIDKINPDGSYKLVEAEYLFGDLIVKNGKCQLPLGNRLGEITDDDIPNHIKKQLEYAAIPLFLAIKNDVEVFTDTGSRIIPLNLFHQGSLLGLFETLDFIFKRKTVPTWSVAAGARTIIILPRITDSLSLKRLRTHFGLPSTIGVRTLNDHWELFKNISHHPAFPQKWSCKALFFGKKWFTDFGKSADWNNFLNYLFKCSWNQAQFSIGKIGLSLSWEKFAETISLRNLKPRPYLVDQAKHLLSIAANKFPAMKPSDNLQQSAPIKELQKVFMDIYDLKHYLPLIMHTCSTEDIQNSEAVYYSLSFPTLLEGSPLNKTSTTIMHDLRDIKLLLDTFKKYSVQDTSPGRNIISNTKFDYFHVEKDPTNEIKSSSIVFHEDPRFTLNQHEYPDKSFCDTSIFWRGCIRIISLD